MCQMKHALNALGFPDKHRPLMFITINFEEDFMCINLFHIFLIGEKTQVIFCYTPGMRGLLELWRYFEILIILLTLF